jgi:PKD repeat protein
MTENATHSFTTAGTYVIFLIVSNGAGCTDSLSKQVVVSNPPTASFDADSGCVNNNINFQNNSTTGTGVTYLWNFGDGNTSTDQNPFHSFTTSGNHTVKLFVTNAGGCTDSFSRTVVVNSTTADFSASNVCVGEVTEFTDMSTTTNGTVDFFNWTFGDAGVSSDRNPTHTYASAGTYTVTLAATSSEGCRGVVTKQVTVHALPNAGFTATPSGPRKFDFKPADSTHSFYVWAFGDGDSSGAKKPTHEYDTIGWFKVTLMVVDANGCTSTKIDSVFSTEPPGFEDIHILRSGVTVYPNPFSDKFTVKYQLTKAADMNLVIYDLAGKVVAEKNQGRVGAGEHTITMKEKLAAGSYTLVVKANGEAVSRLIISVGK